MHKQMKETSCRHKGREKQGNLDRLDTSKLYSTTTPWSESASELYLQSGRRLSAKIVPTFADRECLVVKEQIPTAVFSDF
jgi:hypothetical protein